MSDEYDISKALEAETEKNKELRKSLQKLAHVLKVMEAVVSGSSEGENSEMGEIQGIPENEPDYDSNEMDNSDIHEDVAEDQNQANVEHGDQEEGEDGADSDGNVYEQLQAASTWIDQNIPVLEPFDGE